MSQVVLLRLPQVLAKVNLSRSRIYAFMGAGTFPKPIKLGEYAIAWIESEVDNWVEQRIAARDNPQSVTVPAKATKATKGAK